MIESLNSKVILTPFFSPQAPCEFNPCMGGSTCQPINNEYDFKCACAQGYYGNLCNMCKYLFLAIGFTLKKKQKQIEITILLNGNGSQFAV